ncbi:MRN complex-interacting protein isoform X2 [Hoplias malabaricus]
MCGEKQSLIKEYGRGTGADCRKHVQKLNSLRGELLEAENEKAWTKWEKEEGYEEDLGGKAQTETEEQVKVQAESRWSKYVKQADNGPTDDEDKEGEDNIYTDSVRFKSCVKNSKKRKKSFNTKDIRGHYTVCDDEDTETDSSKWTNKGNKLLGPQHSDSFRWTPAVRHSSTISQFSSASPKTSPSASRGSCATSLSSKHIGINTFSGSFAGANEQPTAHMTTSHLPSVPASNSSSQTSSEGSKWGRFITFPSVDMDKDELDEDYALQISEVTDAEVAHSPPAPMAHPKATLRHTDHLSCGESPRTRGLFHEVSCQSKSSSVFEKLSKCMSGLTSNSPTFTSKPDDPQSPVSLQPPPFKRPCPTLSFTTFFHTDEDFDETL